MSFGVLAALLFVGLVWLNRLEFPYEGPDEAMRPGDQVTIRDPDGICGPLIVSIWKPSVLGQWSQTHNGSAVGDAFSPDAHPWWKVWESETWDTGVPCFQNGEMTFTLPESVSPGTIAVCDSARYCARVEVR